MKFGLILLITIIISCQQQEKFTLVGTWQFESAATPHFNAQNFTLEYHRYKINSVALNNAVKSYQFYGEKSPDSASEINKYAGLIRQSLHRWDSIMLIYTSDSLQIIQNFDFEVESDTSKWMFIAKNSIRVWKPESHWDTGTIFRIKPISSNRILMQQSDTSSIHEVIEYELLRVK